MFSYELKKKSSRADLQTAYDSAIHTKIVSLVEGFLANKGTICSVNFGRQYKNDEEKEEYQLKGSIDLIVTTDEDSIESLVKSIRDALKVVKSFFTKYKLESQTNEMYFAEEGD